MPFGAKNTSFYLSIFMKFFVWWCYYRVLKYSTWVVFDKNLGSPQHPQPPFFGIRRLVTTQIFQNFWSRKFFSRKMSQKNVFLAKRCLLSNLTRYKKFGPYNMHHLGHSSWNSTKKRDLAIFDLTRKSVFRPFWVGGASERGGNIWKKTCEPRVHAP